MKYLHAVLVVVMIVVSLLMAVDIVIRRVDSAQPVPLTSYEVTSDNGMLRSECKVYQTGLKEEPIPGAVEYR
jgi:hypothetical protein